MQLLFLLRWIVDDCEDDSRLCVGEISINGNAQDPTTLYVYDTATGECIFEGVSMPSDCHGTFLNLRHLLLSQRMIFMYGGLCVHDLVVRDIETGSVVREMKVEREPNFVHYLVHCKTRFVD